MSVSCDSVCLQNLHSFSQTCGLQICSDASLDQFTDIWFAMLPSCFILNVSLLFKCFIGSAVRCHTRLVLIEWYSTKIWSKLAVQYVRTRSTCKLQGCLAGIDIIFILHIHWRSCSRGPQSATGRTFALTCAMGFGMLEGVQASGASWLKAPSRSRTWVLALPKTVLLVSAKSAWW